MLTHDVGTSHWILTSVGIDWRVMNSTVKCYKLNYVIRLYQK